MGLGVCTNGDVRELKSMEKSRMHNEGKYVKL